MRGRFRGLGRDLGFEWWCWGIRRSSLAAREDCGGGVESGAVVTGREKLGKK